MDEITHSGIIVWVVGLLGVSGGVAVTIMSKIISTLKGTVKDMDDDKQSKDICNVLHTQISNSLSEIKTGISEAKERVGTLREDLVEIKTILRTGQVDETKRYDRHTDEWKEK